MVNWTKEQETAIYTSGQDVLVAAAAGSGKTAVLVERIIQKLLDKDNPTDIDTLLVVTFTNAAAQEMRNRVAEALEKALANDPSSIHLKKQLSLLQKASITTLHSFCLDIVRQHAYLLDIDPSFRIANDMEADLLMQDVLDDLFEANYAKTGLEQEQFFAVVDRFSSDRNDVDVEKLILDLYTFSIQNPQPESWLDELTKTYQIPENWQEDDLAWLSIIKREVKNMLAGITDEMHAAKKLATDVDGPSAYVETIDADLAMLAEANEHVHVWDDMQTYMQSSKFKALSRKKQDCDEDKKEQVKQLRDRYKKRWNDMKKDWFSRNLQGHIDDMRELAPIISQLTHLVKEFKSRFTMEKKERAIVDFSDLEHYCLEILMEEDAITPSAVAKNLKQQFSELLVDEYQDTNLVQETILTLLRNDSGPGNMFMVGDVKQSIYRFRHAEPTLFIEKYKRFSSSADPGHRIDLARNFRSREQVLTGTNYIFRQILDEALGEINYDSDAELIYGNRMYDALEYAEPAPELLIIDQEASQDSGTEEDEADLEKAELEARLYAEKIKTWIGLKETPPLQVVDKSTGKQRDIQYRDIVLLMRSMTWAPLIVEELKKQGIPVYAELSTGYFEAIEIKVLISFLKTIDNPRQDIPLASVLKSPIVGLNEEVLARIRLADQRGTFYDALRRFSEEQTDTAAQRVQTFLLQLEQFRSAAREGALSELIWNIYRETGYYDFVGGMPGGRQRQANLRALYDRARSYETTSFRGLFRFLRFIERMEERGDDLGAARSLSEQEDVVRMMTIHSSKGLEFPIVIVGALGKEFHLRDLSGKYLLHKNLGFASKFIDPVKRIAYPTLFYHAMKREKLRESLAEEMRILYVALTRAKEKLVMVGNVKSFAERKNKWQRMAKHPEWTLPVHYRLECKTFLDWIGPALIRHDDATALQEEAIDQSVPADIRSDISQWQVTIIPGNELIHLETVDEAPDTDMKESIVQWKPIPTNNPDMTEQVESKLSYQYPYQESTVSRAKQSVTEIKRQRAFKDEYSAKQLVEPFKAPIHSQPTFMQKEKRISAAEVGTAMHAVMQHIPFQMNMSHENIRGFVATLVEREILLQQEADQIDVAAIQRFFATDMAKYMQQLKHFYREIPFSLSLPARDVYANWTSEIEEHVLIQGVLDCVIPTDGGWFILDYKTDAIHGELTEALKEQLANKYKIQLGLYRRALETIWQEPVKAAYVYYFSKQLLLKVPLDEEV